MAGTYLWIVSLMFLGAWLLLWRKKRKFDRQSENGIETFSSYSEKVKADVFDALLLWAGYASFIASVFMLVTIDNTELGWLVIFIMVFLLIKKKHQ